MKHIFRVHMTYLSSGEPIYRIKDFFICDTYTHEEHDFLSYESALEYMQSIINDGNFKENKK